MSGSGRLEGKVAVVTGASRGLGRRICEAFAHEGCEVAMIARGAEELHKAAAAIGPKAMALRADVSDPAAVRSVFARLMERFGGLDILVNNAAVGRLQTIEDADDAQLQAEIAINLLGPIYCIRSAIPLLRGRGGGDIINVTSESVRMPYPFLTVYAAAKSAVETLSMGLRSELRGEGIRVTVLRSGRLAESGFNRDWPEALRARYREAVRNLGFYAVSGQPISPQVTARALVDAVCLPREASVDTIELRSSGNTEGASGAG